MNVIFTCGGTAGHVNPALALAGYLREKDPAARVLFVGTPNGMERGLIEKAGYDFAAVEVSNFHRSLSPKALRHNFKTAKTLMTSRREADAIIRAFQPDLVVGIMTQLGLQVFLNIAVVSGLVPATGISLPFFSYGGTALALQLGEMGIVLSVSRQIPAPRNG